MSETNGVVDDTLSREIKKFLGSANDSREAHCAVLDKLQDTAESMEGIDRYNFKDTLEMCLKKHGRAAVSVCIASTLWENRRRLGNWEMPWALGVLELWAWRNGESHLRAYVRSKFHPTTICTYAKNFIHLNSKHCVEAPVKMVGKRQGEWWKSQS